MTNRGGRLLGLPAWLVYQSVLLAVLLGGFCLLPFAHLWGSLPQPPITDVAAQAAGNPSVAALALVLFGVPSLLPLLLFGHRPSTRLPARQAWPAVGVAVLLLLLPALVSLATYPCCTSDVLDYVNRQRLWAVYGGNPFSVVPDQYPQDWTYAFTMFKHIVVPYGPAWWLATRLFTQFAHSLDEYLVGFKALAAVCYAASLCLVWRLSRHTEDRLARLVFFAWHPILLIDGLVRVHNDLLIVPLALGAFWLYQRGRPAAGLAAVGLGALVKLTAAPLGAPVLVSLVRARRWREVCLGAAACALLSGLLYGPFWFGPGTLASLFWQAGQAQWSLGAGLLYAGAPPPGVRVLLVAAGGGLACVALSRVRAGQPNVGDLASTAALALLVGLLTIPLAMYSHYLMPVIALAAVGSDARVRSLVLAVSVGTLVNATLGADSLAGGVSGTALNVLGSGVLLVSLVLGVALTRGPVRPARAPGMSYEPATPGPA